MGVSGCGKSSIGALFATSMGLRFRDGDDLHPAANIEKMRRGAPLTDDDRWPWLDRIGQEFASDSADVIACSALRRSYRDRIAAGAGEPVTFLYLRGRRETLLDRMSQREGHFMPVALLDSQLATLEEPTMQEDAVAVDIDAAPGAIVDTFIEQLNRRSP